MPKKIENLKDMILLDARIILKKQGYEQLTIRKVANDCHIAVGTVYNYFPSKEMLAAYVMLEDWQKTLAQIKEKCQATEELTQAVQYIYEGVFSFASQYRSSWRGYAFTGTETMAFRKRHVLLIRQIAECVEPFTKDLQASLSPEFSLFVAENILACVNGSPVKIEELINIMSHLEKSYGRK